MGAPGMWKRIGAVLVVLALAVGEGSARADAVGEDVAADATLAAAGDLARAGDAVGAMAAYERFVAAFGTEPALAALERADRLRYGARIRQLGAAHDAMRAFRLRALDYRGLAALEAATASQRRLPESVRRDAAQNAALLAAADGDEERVRAEAAAFVKLGPGRRERGELDFAVANLACVDASLRAGRERCVRAMTSFYEAHRDTAGMGRRLVQATHRIAKTLQRDGDPRARVWCQRTVAAFERFEARSPHGFGTAESDAAAECAFTEIDWRIQAEFDYETGHHRYAGKPDAVLKKFDDDLRGLGVYARELEAIETRFGSQRWTAAALAREASLYDSCRTGLYDAAPPALQLFSPRNEGCWDCDLLPNYTDPAGGRWRVARNAKLDLADVPMVRLYTRAVLGARAWQAPSAQVDRALRRLGFFGDLLGEARMREITGALEDPVTKGSFVYEDGKFLRARPGRPLAIESDLLAPPRPFAP